MTGRDLRRATFALGSNLGDRIANLRGAVSELSGTDGIDVVSLSPVFETDPVGGPDQLDFLNAVVVTDATLSPRALLERALSIEQLFGRQRVEAWGPRTLDIDLLAVGTERIDEPDLKLPHPRAHERPFVLVPWAAVDPDAVLPGRGRVGDLVAGLDRGGVRLRADLKLRVLSEDGPR